MKILGVHLLTNQNKTSSLLAVLCVLVNAMNLKD